MNRSVRLCVEIVAALIGIIAILGLALLWRLETGSLHSAMFTPYLESSLENLAPGTHAEIASSMLSWDHTTRSITLHADAIKITDTAGRKVADIPSIGLRLNPIGVMLGKLLPSELIAEHPQLWIERTADGLYTFGTPTSKNDNSAPAADFSQTLERSLDSLARAHITSRLVISHAVVTVHDQGTKSEWAINIPEISLERAKPGLIGRTQLDLTQKGSFSTITIDYTYDEHKDLHTLKSQLEDINPSFLVGGHPETLGLGNLTRINLPMTGTISFTLDNNQILQKAHLDMQAGSGSVLVPSLWPDQRHVRHANIALDYDRAQKKLDLDQASLDLDGTVLSLTLQGRAPSQPNFDMDFSSDIKIDNLPMDKFAALWPQSIIPDAREWIVANLRKGMFERGMITLKGALNWNDLAGLHITDGQGTLKATHGDVYYIEGMPPIHDANADASFDLKTMTVQITGGNIDDLKLLPFQLTITGLNEYDQYLSAPLQVTGPLPDLFKLIDYPPLGYTTALGLHPDEVTGMIKGTVNFKFPLLKDLRTKDIDIKTNATLTDVASSKLVPGFNLSQGGLDLTLDKNGFDLHGAIAIDHVPMHADWRYNFKADDKTPLFTSTINGTLADTQWAALGLDLISSSKGTTTLNLALRQPYRGDLQIEGTADMTAAAILLKPLNWRKNLGTAASLQFSANTTEQGTIKISRFNLASPGVSAKGRAELSQHGGDIITLDAAPLVMGRTHANIHITHPDSETLHYDISGPSLDISGLHSNKDDTKKDQAATQEYRLRLDRLYTSDKGMIGNINGHATHNSQGWQEIDIHGMADGSHALDIALTNQAKKRTFFITCDDFGKALQGVGLTNSVKDGALTITGESLPDDANVIAGTIKIGHFVVKDLPILALLLNATSPFGIAGLVTDSAEFEKLTGSFQWKGNQITLEQVNAAGSAIGINIDGRLNLDTNSADLRGTVVPFSMVNKILGSIPLIGDLITGGENQGVLAVAYKISGAMSDPKISVNPISLLTPGFIRNLFFGTSSDEQDSQ